ncbi:MAG: hypothetical protein KDH96_01785 [Candidatus Riesia sp.]|nr:hypothetical protein [Candidatus Riesia sp.]
MLTAIKKINWANIGKLTGGFAVGYTGSKIASKKAGAMYDEKYPPSTDQALEGDGISKTPLIKTATSALVTLGCGMGFYYAKGDTLKTIALGATAGAGANTLVNIIAIPQVNNAIPKSVKEYLSGDEVGEDLIDIRDNYSKLYDYYTNAINENDELKNENSRLKQIADKFEQVSKAEAVSLAGEIENAIGNLSIDYKPGLEGESIGSYAEAQEGLNGDEEIEGEEDGEIEGDYDLLGDGDEDLLGDGDNYDIM